MAEPVDGYRIYHDQAGQTQLVYDTVNAADPLATAYSDMGLVNGTEYCYRATSYNTDPVSGIVCESGFSNVLCATPALAAKAGVAGLETGTWVNTGTTADPVWTFEPAGVFNTGSNVVIRAYVVDGSGVPLPEAVVGISITGPDQNTVTVVQLTSVPSDVQGIAEASWQTAGPRRRQPRTVPGIYTATVVDVTATGYAWDGLGKAITFEIQ